LNEFPVESSKAKEGAYSGKILWQRPVVDSSDLGGVSRNAISRGDESQKGGRGLSEKALGDLDLKVLGSQGIQDSSDVKKMLFLPF
jgi:hypothetical protein